MLESAVDFPSSSIRLVVNADGFGLSAARTHGILAAHRNGIVTSTSVLGNAPDPDAIKADLGQAPGLGVGVLLSLEDGSPVAKPESVPSLLDGNGKFAGIALLKPAVVAGPANATPAAQAVLASAERDK